MRAVAQTRSKSVCDTHRTWWACNKICWGLASHETRRSALEAPLRRGIHHVVVIVVQRFPGFSFTQIEQLKNAGDIFRIGTESLMNAREIPCINRQQSLLVAFRIVKYNFPAGNHDVPRAFGCTPSNRFESQPSKTWSSSPRHLHYLWKPTRPFHYS